MPIIQRNLKTRREKKKYRERMLVDKNRNLERISPIVERKQFLCVLERNR